VTLSGEQDFLDLIDGVFPNQGSGLVLGRGDDCALLSVPGALCLSTDLFLEDAHFRRAYFAPEDIGYKALAVNVSDVAAMGGIPLGFSLGLAGPPELGRDFYFRLFSGMAELARATGCLLTGGDLSRAPTLTLCLTIWGRAAGPEFLRRGRVRPGDVIFVHAGLAEDRVEEAAHTLARPGEAGAGGANRGVSGPDSAGHETAGLELAGPELAGLGLARAGLGVLEAGLGPDGVFIPPGPEFAAAVTAHLRPAVRLEAARKLARSGLAHSLMDVSDGLAVDLPRLLAGTGLGADVQIDADQLHPELAAWCAARGLDPAAEAFAGGEDYSLLGSVAGTNWPALRRAVPGLCSIGRASSAPGLRVNGGPPPSGGFDHFRAGPGNPLTE
jgi:thiamine-monophosphate kinase